MAAHVTPTQRQELLRLKAQGFTNIAIADRLGIDRHTVGRQAGPRAPRVKPGALTLSQPEIARLKYLAAALTVEGACPNCGQTMYVVPHAKEGTCLWCRKTWTK